MTPLIEGGKPPSGDRSFYNDKYQVIVRKVGEDLTELSIRRQDRQAIMDWRDVQWIKNQILGPEAEAIQIFPAESRLIDTSNQFYIFGLPPGIRLPIGFSHRSVSETVSVTLPGGEASAQRPFAEHVRPADLEESEARVRRQCDEHGLSHT